MTGLGQHELLYRERYTACRCGLRVNATGAAAEREILDHHHRTVTLGELMEALEVCGHGLPIKQQVLGALGSLQEGRGKSWPS